MYTTNNAMSGAAMGMSAAAMVQAQSARREAVKTRCTIVYTPECDSYCQDYSRIGYEKISYWQAQKTYTGINVCTGENLPPFTRLGMSDGGWWTIFLGIVSIIVFGFVLAAKERNSWY